MRESGCKFRPILWVLVTNTDGSIVLEINTSGWFDLKHWVLSLGAEAKVLEPEELRRDIAEEVRKMAETT